MIFTLIVAIMCFKNFGKGLKQHICGTNENNNPENGVQMSNKEDRKMSLGD